MAPRSDASSAPQAVRPVATPENCTRSTDSHLAKAEAVHRKTRPRKCPVNWGSYEDIDPVTQLLIGYARVSTANQDLASERAGLANLGVEENRVDVNHGLTGTSLERPGLREPLAAGRDGDTLVVTNLDRLALFVTDARDIVDDFTHRVVRLDLGGSVHDPTDPFAVGRAGRVPNPSTQRG